MRYSFAHPLSNTRTWFTVGLTLLLFACGMPGQSQLQNAERLFAAGQLDLAKGAAEHAITANPRLAPAHYLLGQIAEKQQHFPEAFTHYTNTLKWDSDHLDVRLQLGKIFLLANDFDKARKMAEYVLEFRPGNVAARTLSAAVMARDGDAVAAMQFASRIVADHPGDAEAVLLLSGLYARQGKFDEASRLLDYARGRNPTHVALLLAMANNAMAQNQPEQAILNLSAITQLEPYILTHWTRLAAFYESRGQQYMAEEVLRNALRAMPLDEQRVVVLAQFLLRISMPVRAEQELLTAIKKLPRAAVLQIELADLYARTNRWTLAEPLYRMVLLYPLSEAQKTHAQRQFALTLLQLGQPKEAELLAQAMLNADPMNMDAVLLRGKVALANKDYAAAIEDFRAVLRTSANSPETFSLLIKAYVLNNQGEVAKQGLQQAMQADPANKTARWEYAQLLLMLKEYPKALKAMQEFLSAAPGDNNVVNAAIDLFLQHQAWDEARTLMQAFNNDASLARSASDKISAMQRQWAAQEH